MIASLPVVPAAPSAPAAAFPAVSADSANTAEPTRDVAFDAVLAAAAPATGTAAPAPSSLPTLAPAESCLPAGTQLPAAADPAGTPAPADPSLGRRLLAQPTPSKVSLPAARAADALAETPPSAPAAAEAEAAPARDRVQPDDRPPPARAPLEDSCSAQDPVLTAGLTPPPPPPPQPLAAEPALGHVQPASIEENPASAEPATASASDAAPGLSRSLVERPPLRQAAREALAYAAAMPVAAKTPGAALPLAAPPTAPIPAAPPVGIDTVAPAAPASVPTPVALPVATQASIPTQAATPATSPAAAAINNPSAQIASLGAETPEKPDFTLGEKNKNSIQAVDKEDNKKTAYSAGIGRAYQSSAMTPNPSYAAPAAPATPVATPVATPAPSLSPASLATEAVRMVERVNEVADHLAAHPAERVTVRIDLDDSHRVDVHVAMRGGRVHTDFRSDSPEIHAALSAAWDDFSRGDQGSRHRWADPVFSAPAAGAQLNEAAATDPKGGSGSFDLGRETPRRETAEREVAPRWSVTQTRSADLSTPAPARDARNSDTSHHLSILA